MILNTGDVPNIYESDEKAEITEQVKKFVYYCDLSMRSCSTLGKGKVCIRATWPIRSGAYPGFRSMKRLGVFLLPPGWDASPSQGYSPALNSPVPIHTPGWRKAP